MKSRKVKSKIWRDTWYSQLSRDSKLLFLYLITCDDMGLSGYAEIPDRVICFDTGLTPAELAKCKRELSPKVLFANDWVHVVNIQKHDPIKGENNTLHKALERELESVPPEVISSIDAPSMPHISPTDGVIGKGKGKGKGIKGGVGGKETFGDDEVNLILDKFKALYGFSPTDKYPRRVAYNLKQQLGTLLKKRGKDPQNGVMSAAIDGYFHWVSAQDWADKIQNLDTIRRKLPIFEAELPEVIHETE